MSEIQQWLSTVRDVPRIECEILLSETLGLSRAQILAYPERELAAAEINCLDEGVTALRGGTPLAYILGCREFWGLNLRVTPAVLIPRPETELLVEIALECLPANSTMLDLGTGSGAIAIAVASERSDLIITATDISADALAIAMENTSTYDLPINFILSDWFSNLTGQWDLIVSNPPYIAENDAHLPSLSKEPQNALVANNNGLGDIYHIIEGAQNFLADGGHLVIEHGFDQAQAVRQAMHTAGFHHVRSVADLANIERATIGCKSPIADTDTDTDREGVHLHA